MLLCTQFITGLSPNNSISLTFKKHDWNSGYSFVSITAIRYIVGADLAIVNLSKFNSNISVEGFGVPMDTRVLKEPQPS